jgi:hypothetical protein
MKKYVDGINSYVQLKQSNEDFKFINSGYLENLNKSLTIDSDQAILKIKRNNLWSLNVTYNLDKYHGDCNFDESLCGYKKDDNQYFSLEHENKNEWKSINDEQTDFYLSIAKPIGSNVSRAVVYTPQIIERNFTELSELKKESYNKKIFSLSFSFKTSDPTNRLEIFLQTNRSELYLNRNTDEIQLIQRLSINDGELIPQKKSNDCGNHDSNDHQWFRIKNILLYSCYDFRLGFVAVYNNNDRNFINTISTVSIDDVNIDFEKSLSKSLSKIKISYYFL